jgi:nucleotidyltransferase substrate binding protein (TIGR01987 family)
MENKDIRWIQRFNNYKKALAQLSMFMENSDGLNKMEKQGLIKAFEYTYELSWLTIKDFYEYQGESNIQGSKDAFQLAVSRGLVANGDDWFDMIDSRKKTVHTYEEETAEEVINKIISVYYKLFIQLETRLEAERLNP